MSPTCQTYAPQTCAIRQQTSPNLPFTGLDVAALLVVAVVLLAVGVISRLAIRRSSEKMHETTDR